MMNLFFYLKQKYGLGYRVFSEPADSFCGVYDKKNKSDSQNVFGCRSLFFFLFLLWVEFSLYPYQKGFILLLIQFPIFR